MDADADAGADAGADADADADDENVSSPLPFLTTAPAWVAFPSYRVCRRSSMINRWAKEDEKR
ncbi:hypothetical protein HJFPF1_06542 [Paramyrothecium foliicola]|nr:hypothetical protein HJFPF1_06542 [Paramyrothecium foliicola]